MTTMTLGSLFDGIGGWLLAAQHNDIKPLWSCEIDEFASAVSHEHFPDVKQFGDITKINGADLEPVDIICASPPGLDFSVSGERLGMRITRGRMICEAIRIMNEMRRKTNGQYPRYFVWQQVRGALSSDKGQAFRTVLQQLAEAKIPMPKNSKWAESGMVEFPAGSLAWRVLNARDWVPQNQPRIFLVKAFGSASASQILFEPKGMSGCAQEGRAEEEAASRDAEESSGSSSNRLYQSVIGSLLADDSKQINSQYVSQNKCIITSDRVRRLTPLECERLQGLPDGWTAIEYNGKPASDTNRYIALGNSQAQPCVDFVLGQIKAYA